MEENDFSINAINSLDLQTTKWCRRQYDSWWVGVSKTPLDKRRDHCEWSQNGRQRSGVFGRRRRNADVYDEVIIWLRLALNYANSLFTFSVLRYYHLRIRTGYKRINFFVTNRGEKVNKLYDDINKIYGANLSARLIRIMTETSGRSHDPATSTMVAKALKLF